MVLKSRNPPMSAAAKKEHFDQFTQRAQAERERRKKVLDAVVALTEGVADTQSLIALLPILDCGSWDEVAEERSLALNCGFPLCGRNVTQRNEQLYHIDRKAKKIYERVNQRGKFCSELCFENFVHIRTQVDSQPLWMTGEQANRMNKKFELLSSATRLAPAVSEEPSSSMQTIEIVEDTLIAEMNTLKIAERDPSSDEEDEDADQVAEMSKIQSTDELPKTKSAHKPHAVAIRKSTNSEKPAVSRPVYSDSSSQPMDDDEIPEEKIEKPQLPEAQHVNLSSIKFSESEKEKLDRIRNKYSKPAVRRPPVMIEASPLSAKRLKETLAAEKVASSSHETTTVDGEVLHIERKVKEEEMNTLSTATEPCGEKDVEFVARLLRSWWTERSRQLLIKGGLRPRSDMDRIIRQFMAGDREDAALDDVRLPSVDAVDVSKRRLTILFQSLKPSWIWLENRLGIRSSQKDIFWQLLSTFNLDSDTVAGFERIHSRVAAAVIFRLICRAVEKLEEDFFPAGHPSSEICNLLEECSIDELTYFNLCNILLITL